MFNGEGGGGVREENKGPKNAKSIVVFRCP